VLVVASDFTPSSVITTTNQTLSPLACQEEQPQGLDNTFAVPSIVGQSEQIRAVCRLIGLVAQADTTVLIQGESGTGKELVAQAIYSHGHRNQHL